MYKGKHEQPGTYGNGGPSPAPFRQNCFPGVDGRTLQLIGCCLIFFLGISILKTGKSAGVRPDRQPVTVRRDLCQVLFALPAFFVHGRDKGVLLLTEAGGLSYTNTNKTRIIWAGKGKLWTS